MNIFWKELKFRRIALLVWSLAMGVFMWTSMVKFQTFTSDTSATEALLKQMPDTVKTIFGMNGLDATSLGGYFGICFLFIAILLAVHAALLGTGLLTREPLNKTTEFLYTKPVSRLRIVTAKLFAGLLLLAVLWGVTYLASYGSIQLYSSMNGFGATLALFMAATAIIQVFCFTLGMAVAALMRSATGAGKLLTGFVFASYALSLVSQLDGWGRLHYASIFRYFDAGDILNTGSLKLHYVFICVGLSLAALMLVYLRYPHRDLTH
ncbi:MAG: ABC transporter permease subunit [Candidatus Saccharimonas sp.]